MHIDPIQNNLSEQLKAKGLKVTQAKKALINTLLNNSQPLSVPEIVSSIKKLITSLNKTTVYRDLVSLKSAGLVDEIDLGEGKKRYEYNHGNHHHHLICTNCKVIEHYKLDNDLTAAEKKIKADKNFQVSSHTLEFFGLCNNCQ